MIEGLTKAHARVLEVGLKKIREVHRDCGPILRTHAELGAFDDEKADAFGSQMAMSRGILEVATGSDTED